MFSWRTKAPILLYLEQVVVINFRRGAQSYQLLVVAILDFFKMAISENEGIYFVSYILIDPHKLF